VGYDKGRGRGWQVLWFATLHLIFRKWWLPPSVRPVILRAFGADVGQDVLIRHGVRIQWPWKLSLGNDVWVGEGAWLLNLETISVGSDVCISQEAMLCTGSHDRRSADFAMANRPIVISDGAWIGARSVVLCGTRVGSGALVGAGAIAHGDVADDIVLQPAEPRSPGSRWSTGAPRR
jgi:putative colanic acid biosynthesis acetyltransferase WcaF